MSNKPPVKESVIKLYKSSDKIQSRSIKGVFNSWRWIMVWITQLFFYGMPWLNIEGRQALLFDLENKRFYIYWLVLNPQDLIYLTFLLIISAMALFLFTAVAGRLWCGFTCPQTVYTEIFVWIEEKFEGNRLSRIKLDESKWSFNKLARKLGKQSSWILFSLWTGITFVGFFTPIRELVPSIFLATISGWELFWVIFYSFATYGNAGYMREQVCKYMCPYARFQSAMFDDDTLIVTYDKDRGEPRGARNKKEGEHENGKGSCIDCNICVQVCPVGIDIRNGLQYECISCGLCVDACDSVMDKMGYDRGLIKFTTQKGIDNKWSKSKIIKRILRPRVLIYSAILWVLIIGMSVSLYLKPDFKADIISGRAGMTRIADDGALENAYSIKIQSNSDYPSSYSIALDDPRFYLHFSENNSLLFESFNPFESRSIIFEIRSKQPLKAGSYPLKLSVKNDEGFESVEKTVFLVLPD